MSKKGIITKDKNKFLLQERYWFPSMNDEEYKAYMTKSAKPCEICGIYHWTDYQKRCECL